MKRFLMKVFDFLAERNYGVWCLPLYGNCWRLSKVPKNASPNYNVAQQNSIENPTCFSLPGRMRNMSGFWAMSWHSPS